MNIATAVAGRLKGGAAKVSVLSSALFGSISGSASANVASTGAITLPAMIKLNYPKSLAGAVEAVASSGGQIMPPLMGAGAFVMVELTGVPYNDIMGAALLPALLYFLTVWVALMPLPCATICKGSLRKACPTGQLFSGHRCFFRSLHRSAGTDVCWWIHPSICCLCCHTDGYAAAVCRY